MGSRSQATLGCGALDRHLLWPVTGHALQRIDRCIHHRSGAKTETDYIQWHPPEKRTFTGIQTDFESVAAVTNPEMCRFQCS